MKGDIFRLFVGYSKIIKKEKDTIYVLVPDNDTNFSTCTVEGKEVVPFSSQIFKYIKDNHFLITRYHFNFSLVP